ncbi:hypothetical protein BC936DRAFT_144227 [Jimgerdemannia flammicorona]|uniref:Uncharacterized protein n=1 Tax=Jimgerdemannia flammicorona TaxID=994334 RepID=A0A432ZYH7_9FUNG|nr:hypothetical protein BC936DRAFT_144227 [Jimgerdemannia flammicorona]
MHHWALASFGRPRRAATRRNSIVGVMHGAFWGDCENLSRSLRDVVGVAMNGAERMNEVEEGEASDQLSFFEGLLNADQILIRFAIKRDAAAPNIDAGAEEDAAYRRCLSVLLGDGVDE